MDTQVIELSPIAKSGAAVHRTSNNVWGEKQGDSTGLLKEPCKVKEVRVVSSGLGVVVTVTARGWQKKLEEDCIAVTGEDRSIGGVVSGGNSELRKVVTTSLPSELTTEFQGGEKNETLRHPPTIVAEVTRKAYYSTDATTTQFENTACSAVAAYISSAGQCIVSSIGSCAAFVSRSGKLVPVSHQHVPSSEWELARIEAAGDRVAVNGMLNDVLTISRGFGYSSMKCNEHLAKEEQSLVPSPDVTMFDISEVDEFVVLGNEGFRVVMEDQENSLDEIFERIRVCVMHPSVKKSYEALEEAVTDLADALIAPSTPYPYGTSNVAVTVMTLQGVGLPSRGGECFLTTSCELLNKMAAIDVPCSVIKYASFDFTHGERLHPIDIPSEPHTTPLDHRPRYTAVLSKSLLFTIASLSILGIWDAARESAYYLPVLDFATAITLTSLLIYLHKATLKISQDHMEVLVTFLPVIFIIAYDLCSGCVYDCWVALCVGLTLHVVFPGNRLRYLGISTGVSTLWISFRTAAEAFDLGLYENLDQGGIDATHGDRGGKWFVGEMYIRLGVVVGLAALVAAAKREMRLLNAKLMIVRECLLKTTEMAISRDLTEVDNILTLSYDADPDDSGRIANTIYQLTSFLRRQTITRNSKSIVSDHSLIDCTTETSGRTDESEDDQNEPDSTSPSTHRASPQPTRSKTGTIFCIQLAQELDLSVIGTFTESVTAAVDTMEGTVVAYLGNSITAAWNAYRPLPHHGQAAVSCAMAIHSRLHVCQWNIGLTCGAFYLGKEEVASKRLAFVVGKGVTMAQPLARWAKNIQAKIVLVDKVYEQVRSMIYARPIDSIQVHNDRPDIIYELQGSKQKPCPASCSTAFTEAFASMQQLHFETARGQFVDILSQHPSDKQAKRLLAISAWLAKHDNIYVQERHGYCRRLASELEIICSGMLTSPDEEWSFSGSDNGSTYGPSLSPRRDGEACDFASLKRESLQHDKVLRRQIRDAEAEANADQLVAWGLMPAGGKPVVARKEKPLPTRFKDHKGREWCRADRSLGKGAFGEVWLGMGSDGGLVAMKSMRLPTAKKNLEASDSTKLSAAARRRLARKQGGGPGAAANPTSDLQQIEDLLREVGLMHKLRHENIVLYMGSSVVDGFIMIVMEYLSGGSLHDMLVNFSTGTIPQTSLQRYVQDIVRGLEFLHQHDIIHRDMKPHNVLLNVDGQCKLADFGASAGLSQLAKTNQGVIGTPLYMAPEACKGEACKASDVWGLGIMMCQLFTGVVPYRFHPGEPFNPHTFLYKLGHTSDFVPEVPLLLPHDARNMASACLKLDPEARPAASELCSFPFVLS